MTKQRVVNHFLWKSESRMIIWKLISTLVFIITARALVILLWLDFSRKFVSFTVLCLTGVQITECASLFLFCLVVLNHCFIPVYTHSSGNAYSQLGKQSPRVSRQLSAGLAPLLKALLLRRICSRVSFWQRLGKPCLPVKVTGLV